MRAWILWSRSTLTWSSLIESLFWPVAAWQKHIDLIWPRADVGPNTWQLADRRSLHKLLFAFPLVYSCKQNQKQLWDNINSMRMQTKYFDLALTLFQCYIKKNAYIFEMIDINIKAHPLWWVKTVSGWCLQFPLWRTCSEFWVPVALTVL